MTSSTINDSMFSPRFGLIGVQNISFFFLGGLVCVILEVREKNFMFTMEMTGEKWKMESFSTLRSNCSFSVNLEE